MKKKFLSLTVAIGLLATAAIGGTLAYFTDTDAEDNVFTMGNVSIDLVEKQYDEEDKLVDFVDNKELMPGNQNKQDKIVTIENDGSNDAYVWYEWLIPAALDSNDGSTGTNNVLHVNSYGATWDDYYTDTKYTLPTDFTKPTDINNTWDHDPEEEITSLGVGPQGYIDQEEIDNVTYNKYLVLYRGIVPAKTVDGNGTTTPAMNGVYLDMDLDTEVKNGKTVYTCHGQEVDYDFSAGITIPVRAYGIQAEGFDSVYDAYKAYAAQTATQQ
ncbi:MAG: hypothetical protein IJB55_06430 [Firmicutes bacterium]|nr:hypothetical protein [Bacillota bacterium]